MTAFVTYVVVGLASGSIYALAATGLVLTYRASGMFNFAHGSVATVAAYLFYVGLDGLPWPVAFAATILIVGGLGGVLMEWVARQVRLSTYASMVVTIGLVLVVQGAVWALVGTDARFVVSPLPRGSLVLPLVAARIGTGDVVLLVIGVATTLAVRVLLVRTRLGLLMRAVVDNPALVARMGVDPDRVRLVSWIVGASTAALAGVLLAPQIGLEPVVLTFLVVQSFGAAAIGGFTSLTRTYAGALTIGVAASLAAAYVHVDALRALPTAVPFLVLVGVLVVAPPAALRERVARGYRTAGRPAPLRLVVAAAVAGLVATFGVLQFFATRLPVATTAAATVIVFLGLSLITNLAGHLSLCHAALAAVGATTFGNLASVVPWPLALVGASTVAVVVSVLVSIVAGRLSEVALAIATFGFANLLVAMVYGSAWMFGRSGSRHTPRPVLFNTDGSYFVLVAAFAIAACLGVAALNRSRPGRVFRALAVAPETLAAVGTSPLMARAALFALGGGLAGLGGALAAGGNLSTSAAGYPAFSSLLWVAALAFGGRGVVSGAVRAGLAVVLAPYFFANLLGDHTLWLFGVVAVGVAVVSTRRAAVRA
jgi:branched-subunit amino acid ABC-type transport system permease component